MITNTYTTTQSHNQKTMTLPISKSYMSSKTNSSPPKSTPQASLVLYLRSSATKQGYSILPNDKHSLLIFDYSNGLQFTLQIIISHPLKASIEIRIFKNGMEYVVSKHRHSLLISHLNSRSENRSILMGFDQLRSNVVTTSVIRLPEVGTCLRSNIKRVFQKIDSVIGYFKRSVGKVLEVCGERGVEGEESEGDKKLQELAEELIAGRQSLLAKESIDEFVTMDSLPKVVDKTGYKAIFQNIKPKPIDSTTSSNKLKQNNLPTPVNNLQKYSQSLRSYPFPKIPNQRLGVYSKISFQSPSIEWSLILQTTSMKLLKAYTKIRFQGSQVSVDKHLIRKEFIGPNARINYQKEARILRALERKTSVNIGKYYYVEGQEYQTSILMDLIAESSVDTYVKNNSNILSLRNKMTILGSISQGIRFLRDCGIIHMDLKFQNILMGRGLIPKIIDFGESIDCSTTQMNEVVSSGHTLPYTAHERLSKPHIMKNLRDSTDTYSFGVMIDYLLMNRHILPFRRSSQSQFTPALRSVTYPSLISFTPQKYLNLFPSKVSPLIWTIVLNSLHPNSNQRPNMDIVTITLKAIESYLTSI